MTKETFDENRVIGHQKRAINKATVDADFLSRRIAEEFALRIAATNRQFSRCADLFSLSNCVYRSLNCLDNVTSMTRYERESIAGILNSNIENTVYPIHVEKIDNLLKGVDLLVSAFGLHWKNDVTAMLTNVCGAMKKDGLLLVALPARGTLFELQDCLTKAELELCGGITSRIDQFIDLLQAGSLLQNAGFKLPVIDQEKITVRYDDMFALITDIRAMGAANAQKFSGSASFHPDLFDRANELYAKNYSDADGRIRASFCVAYLTAWSPHENQQKPLKPGSAETSLSSYLKSKL